MADCEICGREGQLQGAIVEGSTVVVCSTCVTYGHVIPIHKDYPKPEFKAELDEPENSLVPNYGKIIQQVRTIMNLTQAELARKIHEKESLIKKIEIQHIAPTNAIIHKIESILRIKLTNLKDDQERLKKSDFKNPNLTIGDLFKKRNNGNEEKSSN